MKMPAPMIFTAAPQLSGFAVIVKGKPMLTPGKNPLIVPTHALAEALATEWQVHQKFMAGQMKLTALAYTAIDRVAGQEENIAEVLLAYADTDTLSYRSSTSEALAKEQRDLWDPILVWAGARFSAIWQTTAGVMPVEQPEALHQRLREYFMTVDAMRLSAACVLSSVFSSLVLTLAVLEKHLPADRAFDLSRLEEEAQARQWGRDEEAGARTERVKAEILAVSRFLRLLEPSQVA